MRYTYDPGKRASNLAKHGLDFEAAHEVIESSRTLTFEDKRFDCSEQRFITLGLLKGEVVVLVTTETANEIRVISMRQATRHERALYFQSL